MKRLEFVDFSKLDPAEATVRLEKVQTALYDLAMLQAERLRKVKGEAGETLAALPSIGFTDGTLHGTCIALDFLQGREPGTNLRGIMKVPAHASSCDDPLFV